MSERLESIETEETAEESQESWDTGEHYSRMNIDTGTMGTALYYSLPALTILTKTQEDLETMNEEFSVLFSKYTDHIIVGTPHEASLVLSLNQAAADLVAQEDVVQFLRNKIHELTGSYEEAGDWQEES